MSVGEWLDATFTMYRRNFALIASISAVVQIPYALLTLLLFEVTGVAAFVRSPFTSISGQTLTPAQAQTLLNSLSGVLAVSLGLLIVSLLIVLPLGEAATTRAVSDRYLDNRSSLGAAYGATWKRLPSLIAYILIIVGASLVLIIALVIVVTLFAAAGAAVVGAVVGLVAAAVLAFAVAVRTVIAVPAIVLERVSGWGGLKRSWNLVSGRFWPTFGRWILLGIISGIMSGVVTTILDVPASSLDPNNAFIYDQVASTVASVFIGPITYIGVTLLYYDARIRKEGFDIEMLARSL